jgi:hypothetical protein
MTFASAKPVLRLRARRQSVVVIQGWDSIDQLKSWDNTADKP